MIKDLEPINVKIHLKKFIVYMKQILKERSGSFFSDNNTLVYYLEGSDRFNKDYKKYLSIQEIIEKDD